jgi:hypothetical protein
MKNLEQRSTEQAECRCGHEMGESGVFSAFLAVLAVAMLLLVGLVVDVGRAIAVQRLAADEAEQAARTGAGQISVNSLRQGQVSINSQSAITAAERYTVQSGQPGIATVNDGTVSVRVVVVLPTTILDIADIKSMTVSATASASDVAGIARPS